MTESYKRWDVVPSIDWPAAGARLVEDHHGLRVTLLFSEVVEGSDRDLELQFGRVVAFSSHEELAHPWNDAANEPPRLSGKWSQYSYPCLLVEDSDWVRSFPESLLFGRGDVQHYRLVTLDKTVDVLTTTGVAVSWLKPEPAA